MVLRMLDNNTGEIRYFENIQYVSPPKGEHDTWFIAYILPDGSGFPTVEHLGANWQFDNLAMS